MWPTLPQAAWVADHSTIALTLDSFQETPVDAQARADFPDLLVAFGEGNCSWGYPDNLGNITIGRGNLIPDLAAWMAIVWENADGSAPNSTQVQAAWVTLQGFALRVKANGPRAWPGGGAYEHSTRIRATKASVDALIQRRLDEFDAILRRDWAAWDAAPPAAQSVLMRLMWSCGPFGFTPKRWPRLHIAWCAEDWAGCARECRIPALDATEPGANERARNMFLSCVVADTEPAPPDA